MKRLLALLLCLVMALSLIPAAGAEDIEIVESEPEDELIEVVGPEEAEDSSNAGVAISKTNFPDAVFRTYVSDFFDGDDDGRLSAAEIKQATEIEISRQSVSSLKGIERLTSLETLDCSWNDLTALDLSKNTALTQLYCAHNDLTALDVSANAALVWLNCGYNQLTALDVGSNAALIVLVCGYNKLTKLDVSVNPQLQALDCWSNRLSRLDLSKNPLLISLDCSSNRLTRLDLSRNTALTEFWCCGNRLTALDLSHNTALRTFWCYNNRLTELDVSRNTALTELNCGGNQLTALDVSDNPNLECLWVWGNLLSAIDLSCNTALVCFFCESNQLSELDLSALPDLKELRCLQNPLGKVYVHRNAQLVSVEKEESTEIVKVAPARPAIIRQPASQSAVEGDTVRFKIKASAATEYQWYYRTSSAGAWTKCTGAGAETAELCVEAKGYRSGYQYRCRATNVSGSKSSAAATLTVLTKPTVTTQPTSKTAAVDTNVKFAVKATGGVLSYQWQYRRSSTGTWYNSTQTGNRTATLTVTATAARNGFQYRCRVKNAAGTVYSRYAKLTVCTKPVITTQPTSKTAAVDTTVKFTVKATGGALSYQWQYRKSSTGTWYNSTQTGNRTATLTVTATAARNGFQYRCRITNVAGTTYSKAVTLTVK